MKPQQKISKNNLNTKPRLGSANVHKSGHLRDDVHAGLFGARWWDQTPWPRSLQPSTITFVSNSKRTTKCILLEEGQIYRNYTCNRIFASKIFKSFWYSRWLCPQKFEWKNYLPPKWSNLSSESFGTREIDQVDRVESPFPLCLIHPCRCHIFLTGSACAHLIICTPRSISIISGSPSVTVYLGSYPPSHTKINVSEGFFDLEKLVGLKHKESFGFFDQIFTTSRHISALLRLPRCITSSIAGWWW